jgi:hypothetical protein
MRVSYLIPLFVSYSHLDEPYFKELRLCLDDIRMDIDIWHDAFITPGQKWDSAIRSKLDEAEIVVFILSGDFLKSNYIKRVEIARVLEKKQCVIVCVIARPVPMDNTNPLSIYQSLPRFAKPVSDYKDPVIAWLEIKSGIQKVIADIQRAKIEVYSKGSSDVVGRKLQTTRKSNSFVKLLSGFLALLGIAGTVYSYIKSEGDFHESAFNISLPLIMTFAAVFVYLFSERQQSVMSSIVNE